MEQEPKNQKDNQDQNGPKNKQTLLMVMICLLISLLFFGLYSNFSGQPASKEITYDKFVEMVEEDQVRKVVIDSDTLVITPKEQKVEGMTLTYSVTLVGDENELGKLLDKHDVEYSKKTPDMTSAVLSTIFSIALPILLLVVGMNLIMRYMNKSGGMMGVGKSKAKAYIQQETGITFKDVAGQDEAKESLQEVVEFLHNPERYVAIGAKLPKGALLVGPPGTGKTLLAKAVAGEAHVPFFSLSGSEFVEMFVGVGASRVRDLFEEAKKNAPCIIFIDEIDAIGKTRDTRYGGNDEREQTLNQLLAVGYDLANMINEAAILAVKNGRNAVSQKDLFEAVEIVLVGKEKKDRILSQEERRIVSYHEVGHALVSALQKDSEPVQKITIVPRTMGALGYVMQVPEEEKYLNTKKELEAMVVGLLAGRAAEELVFDNVTTGAANDIERATKVVRAMITQYGMSEKFGLMGLAEQENQYLEGRTYLNCGDATATEIDHEVMEVLKAAYVQAKKLLADNRDALDKIADFLIQRETITGKEFMEIFHEVQADRKPDEGAGNIPDRETELMAE